MKKWQKLQDAKLAVEESCFEREVKKECSEEKGLERELKKNQVEKGR